MPKKNSCFHRGGGLGVFGGVFGSANFIFHGRENFLINVVEICGFISNTHVPCTWAAARECWSGAIHVPHKSSD